MAEAKENRDNRKSTEEVSEKDKSYNHSAMEKKWQDKWEADKLYRVGDRREQAQALRPDDAAVSQRRPAHRSLVSDDALRMRARVTCA